jgi:DNA primase
MSEINQFASVDITQLAIYLDKIKDISSLNKMMGAAYLRDFIQGQDVAGALLAKAIQADIKAKSKLDQAEAIAYLDRATEYLKDRNIKDSSEARKRYVDIDEEVMTAKDNKAKTEALVSLLKNKLSILRQSHDDLKKILYGDSNMSQWEGM